MTESVGHGATITAAVQAAGDLEEQLRQVHAEMARMREELAALRRHTRDRAEPVTVSDEPAPRDDPLPSEPIGRRRLLAVLGGAAAGGIGLALASARPAAAADNDAMRLGVNNSATAPTTLISPSSNTTLAGYNSGTGPAVGGQIANSSSGAPAVLGLASAGPGVSGNGATGVRGVSNNGGIGTYGNANGKSTAVGVYGSCDIGTGVKGVTSSGTGVIGLGNATGSTGVQGKGTALGVYGESTATSGAVGVFGVARGSGSRAVAGWSDVGTGMYAESASGIGLVGTSNGVDAGVGVAGTSPYIGVEGTATHIGVDGTATGYSGTAIRASAMGEGGTGVFASGGEAGVSGHGTGPYGIGVVGDGAYGLVVSGDIAPICLNPQNTAGRPTSGAHQQGELLVDSAGVLWFCSKSGTPGTWGRVAITVV